MKKYISFITAMAVTVAAAVPVIHAEGEIEISTAAELASAAAKGGSYKIADGINIIDCSETAIQPKGTFSLDFNGAEVRVNSNGFDMQNGSAVTLKNGTITGEGTYTVKVMPSTTAAQLTLDHITASGAQNGIATANSYAAVEIKNCNLTGTKYGIAGTMGNYIVTESVLGGITLGNESTIVLTGSTVTGAGNGLTSNSAASAVITDSSLEGAANNYGVYWASSGSLELTDSTVTVDSNGKGTVHGNNSTGTITIQDCILSNTCETAAKAYLFTSNSGDAAQITVTGGIYTGINAINSASQTSLVINSGMFSADPSKYTAEGKAAYLNEDGMYEVVDSDAVPTSPPEATPDPDAAPSPTGVPAPAPTQTTVTVIDAPERPEQMTTVKTAEELAAAVSAKTAGIELGADIDLEAAGIKTTCVTYLDLNGHTLTGYASAIIEIAHSFTLTDTAETKGAIINTNSSTSYALKIAVKNIAVEVSGAEIDASSQAILLNAAGTTLRLSDAVLNGGSYTVNMANGSLIIDSAVMNGNADYLGYALYVSGGDAVVNDGSFHYNGTVSSVVVSGSADMTINGGTFTNANAKRGAINNAKGFTGTLTINGGEFENTYDGTGYSILDSDEATTEIPPQIIINGGEFHDAIGFSKPANTTTVIKISGGSFAFDPAAYLAEGCSASFADGIYTVTASGTEKTADVDYTDGVLTIEFTNLGDTEGTVYAAQYDGNGVLIGLSAITLEERIEENIEQKSDDMRIFIWDNNQKNLFSVLRPQRGAND